MEEIIPSLGVVVGPETITYTNGNDTLKITSQDTDIGLNDRGWCVISRIGRKRKTKITYTFIGLCHKCMYPNHTSVNCPMTYCKVCKKFGHAFHKCSKVKQ